jgi:hypothetical protein
LIVTNEGENY